MFPNSNEYRSINSSAIEVTWFSSSAIKSIDLTQLVGTMTIGLYAGDKFNTYSSLINYPLTKLNESGSIIINHLNADSIYKIIFQIVWKDNATSGYKVKTSTDILVRIYMKDDKTLNDVPRFGSYVLMLIEVLV